MQDKQVLKPYHYTYGKYECKDIIAEVAGKDFFLGSAIKYIWRAKHKGTEAQDIRKAIRNLEYYLEVVDHE